MDATTRRKLLRELRADRQRIDDLITWLSQGETNGDTPAEPPRKRVIRRPRRQGPSVREYVLRALDSNPSPWASPGEIVDHVLALGWQSNSANRGTIVRNNLRRMEEASEVVKNDEGEYALASRVSK